jgi:hypothetical protein
VPSSWRSSPTPETLPSSAKPPLKLIDPHAKPNVAFFTGDDEELERKTIDLVALAASVSARPLVRHPVADEMNVTRQPVVAADLRQLSALMSESDDSTRLSFPSTAPGREVFQSNVAAGIC